MTLDTNGSIKNAYQNYIAVSKYARWLEEENRRETWSETVDRYFTFMRGHLLTHHQYEVPPDLFDEIQSEVLNLNLMPSMRALMTAGPALERENMASYNCSFVAVDSPRVFDEAMYVLMNGTGLGFSVEQKHIGQLPIIADEMYQTDTTIVVADSKLGWAKALKELVSLLYSGQVPSWDVSKVRPEGSRLKTFGGRASGPEPLVDVFEFFVSKFNTAKGRQLRPLEVHDLICKIAQVVVVGGVRRSALISLSDLGDNDMAGAKSGRFWADNSERYLANNSAMYNNKPSLGTFMREWLNLYESNSGERGIVNIGGARQHIDSFGRRDSSKVMGVNPCSEIYLRSGGLCNLSEVVVRADDTVEQVRRRIQLAAIMGTWQSSLTNFKYVRPMWKKNAEEERLLGVSLTGVFDNKHFNGSRGLATLGDTLDSLRETAVAQNASEASNIGINPSVAVTCVKPSGTVSQLVDCASGGHPRFARKYERTVRASNNDPLTQFLKDTGVPNEPDVTSPDKTTVFSFPIYAGEDALTRNDVSAVQQLDVWRTYKQHWTEHNPSVTINVKDDEWFEVADWVYKNFDDVAGLSFLPHDGHVYKQAPYQDLTDAQYDRLVERSPDSIDWSILSSYESSDEALKSQGELACTAGACEIVDLIDR